MKLQHLRENLYKEAVSATSWLRKWLDDDEVDPYHWSWLIPTWAQEMDVDINQNIVEENDFDSLPKPQQNSFKMWLKAQYETGRLFQYGPDFDQANLYFSGGKVVKTNDWLIHFTPKAKDAFDIAANGFKYGVDSRNLHISATADKFDREFGEFAFAFRIDGSGWKSASRQGKYGMNAVMFQTESGIESYHTGDDENQVIFHKDMTRNRVPIYYSERDGEWFVEDKKSDRELIIGSLDDVVAWVKKNFSQYRKSIAHGAK
jgi:hypothetical protein